MNDKGLLAGLARISSYAGERFDLVQAGGGNSSVKLEGGDLLIKASGVTLSEVSEKSGCARVPNAAVLSVMANPALAAAAGRKEREALSKKLLAAAVPAGSPRPSIETFLHAMLGRFVLHTHPVAVVAGSAYPDLLGRFASRKEGFLAVPYATPGVELALALKAGLAARTGKKLPGIIVLENHGLIASADTPGEVIRITESVTAAFERALGADLARFRRVSAVSAILRPFWRGPLAVHRSSDADLLAAAGKKRLMLSAPASPDTLVFCGRNPVVIPSEGGGARVVKAYVRRWGEPPKVLLLGGGVFFAASGMKKAREAEEVFKAHVMAAALSRGRLKPLPREELDYLSNWEAEKFRRTL